MINKKHKTLNSILGLVMAVALLFTFNFTFLFNVKNYATTAQAVYTATEEKSYNFDPDTSNFSSMTASAGNSGEYSINRNVSLIDLTYENGYYPIAKYNGVSTLSKDRTGGNIGDIDKLDDYAAAISTNNYSVTRKVYTTDDNNNYIFETDGEKAVIYVATTKGSNEEQSAYEARVEELNQAIIEINSKLPADSNFVYKAVSVTERASSSFGNDFSQISTEADEYTEINTQISALEGLTKTIGGESFSLANFTAYHKKTSTYEENSIYFRTSSSITLESSNYYVLSVWVYTAGDATASVVVGGTNFQAKADGISTNGKWQQIYLFMATKSTASTSVYIYLYYGDTTGVTGPDKTVSDYDSTKMNGTVVFDGAKLSKINYTDYVSQTINGFDTQTIAKANFAKDYTYENIVNNAKATKTTDPDTQETTITYEEAKYTSTYDGLVSVESYTARHGKTFDGFDANFQSSGDKTSTDSLVYSADDVSELNFDTYLSASSKMFSYYMPRYTTDTSTTFISGITKTGYRNQYETVYANEILAGSTYKFASVVAEEDEFEEYSKDELDALGNNVTEIDAESGETVNKKLEHLKNNTFSVSGEKNYILKIDNTTSYELGLTTKSFVVPALAYYKVSVFVYSADSDATATVKLFSTIKTKDSQEFGTLVLASANQTDFEYNGNDTNGWKEIVFYIKGNPTANVNANLALLASKESVVYFDNITIEAVNSSSYSNGSNKIDLSSYGIISSNVKNGNFEAITVSTEGDLAAYPYVAESWTISDSTTDNVIHGIVSTKDAIYKDTYVPLYENGKVVYYEEDEITSSLVYGKDYLLDYDGKYIKTTTLKDIFGYDAPKTTLYGQDLTEENVYGVFMPTAAAGEEDPTFVMTSANIGYSSSTSTLNSKTVYKLTYQIWLGDNFSGTITGKLTSGSNTLADINIDSSSIAKNTWQTITYYIRTGLDSRSSIKLELGATKSHGTMFIQKVDISALSEKTDGNVKISVDDQFEEIAKTATGNYVRIVDLLDNNFTMHSTKVNEDTGLYDSYSYTLETLGDNPAYTQGVVGVIKAGDSFEFDEDTIVVLQNNNTTSNTYLMIKNGESADYSVVNSITTSTLASSSFYKVTFDVKTSDMGENGLKVTAKGFEDQNAVISNINTANVTDNNGYKTYTFYLRTGSSSVSNYSLKFELGNSSNSFAGWALVSNIDVESLTEDEYTEITTKEETKADSSIVVASQYVETSSSSSSSSTADSGNFSWQTFFLVFSSILLVVSLVVALVAVIVNRKKKNKAPAPKNVGSNDKTGSIQ